MPKLESGELEPRSNCNCGELNDPGEDFVIPEANDNDNDNDDDDDTVEIHFGLRLRERAVFFASFQISRR